MKVGSVNFLCLWESVRCLMFAFIPFGSSLDGDSEKWLGFGRLVCKLRLPPVLGLGY